MRRVFGILAMFAAVGLVVGLAVAAFAQSVEPEPAVQNTPVATPILDDDDVDDADEPDDDVDDADEPDDDADDADEPDDGSDDADEDAVSEA